MSQDEKNADRAVALLTNPAFGEGQGDSAERIKLEMRVLSVMGLVAYAVGWWGLIFAAPYKVFIYLEIALCVAAVFIAYVKRKTSSLSGIPGRIWIGSIALMPALTLGLRAYWDTAMMNWQGPWLWALAAGALVVLLVAFIEGTINLGGLIWLAPFACSACLGVLIFANRFYDESVGRPVPASVLDKSADEYSGKPATSYELFLSAWADRHASSPVSVPHRFHSEVSKGDVVCVEIHDGALGFEWYEVDHCDQ